MTRTLIGKCSKILGPPPKYVPWCWWGAKRSIKRTQNRERVLPLAPVEILYIFHIKTVFHVHMCILYFFWFHITSVQFYLIILFTDTQIRLYIEKLSTKNLICGSVWLGNEPLKARKRWGGDIFLTSRRGKTCMYALHVEVSDQNL